MVDSGTPLGRVVDAMRRRGADRVVFKLLANNDNSKNQIYFGGDFDVLRMIPHGDLFWDGQTGGGKGFGYKAPLNLHWMAPDGTTEPAPNARLILYPKYPEVRMSGFLRGCRSAPSGIMRAPTRDDRARRSDRPRVLVLGIRGDGSVLAFAAGWDSPVSREARAVVDNGTAQSTAGVFHEISAPTVPGQTALLRMLTWIHCSGAFPSQRMDRDGNVLPYHGRNGAGTTLESLFSLVPNSASGPDYLGWELKACKPNGVVTLLSSEPDSGTYVEDFGAFLNKYGWHNPEKGRSDFAGRHLAGSRNARTGLTMRMEGMDGGEIVQPDGGIILRDDNGEIAIGWTFQRLMTHWSHKHAKAAYVSYSAEGPDPTLYRFGPGVRLCWKADLLPFLTAIRDGRLYYDPGSHMGSGPDGPVVKKRNQFRIRSRDVPDVYGMSVERVLECP